MDAAVLSSLLQACAKDPEFPVQGEKTAMVLHIRTPEKSSPLLNTAQVGMETGGKALPNDAWNDLVRGNVIKRHPESREIYYEGLNLGSDITVSDAYPWPQGALHREDVSRGPSRGKRLCERLGSRLFQGWEDGSGAGVGGTCEEGRHFNRDPQKDGRRLDGGLAAISGLRLAAEGLDRLFQILLFGHWSER